MQMYISLKVAICYSETQSLFFEIVSKNSAISQRLFGSEKVEASREREVLSPDVSHEDDPDKTERQSDSAA